MLNANYDDKDKYTEKVTKYDKNGNIKKLQRYSNVLIDDLTYTYNGNQLTRVDDATGWLDSAMVQVRKMSTPTTIMEI